MSAPLPIMGERLLTSKSRIASTKNMRQSPTLTRSCTQTKSPLHCSFLLNSKRRVGAINNLALAITSHEKSTADFWPLVTLPDFERRVSGVLDQAQVISLTFMPLVTNKTRNIWETYSEYKQDWFLESMAVRREEQIKLKGIDNVLKEEAESLAALETVGDGLDKTFRINPNIYRIDGHRSAPDTSDGPYLPVGLECCRMARLRKWNVSNLPLNVSFPPTGLAIQSVNPYK